MRFNDSFALGLLLGAVVPVLGYILITSLFELLTQFGIMEEISSSISTRRMRTILLLSICCNLLPFNVFRRLRYTNSMRGIIFPTLFYVGSWIYLYKDVLFANF